CEDTRTTKKLLSKYGIKNDLISYHEYNEFERSKDFIEILKEGKRIAIVSDAGTPSICDPGYRIVRLSVDNGIEVISIPGASAVISALIISGLSTDSFIFLGFFPKANKKTRNLLQNIKILPQTLVFYESPKRVLKSLELISEELGDRHVSISRELTKMYEETIRGSISEVIIEIETKEIFKGEMVIVVEGYTKDEKDLLSNFSVIEEKLKVMYKENVSLKSSVDILSDICEVPRNIIYEAALKIWAN
ncbi:MAG: 16S rRNA (cytidine(1402)-2'-O)-methyltransferase, partial [Thermodesulfobacteriota bacterium]